MTRFHRHSAKVTRSRRWPALRLAALRRDGFNCRECGARGRLEVDHIEPVRAAPERAFDLSNLQSLCVRCHGAKTRREVGLPELSPARKAWRNAVTALQKSSSQKEKTCSPQ